MLERGGTSLGLIQVCSRGCDDLVEGADCVTGGLHAQTMCQVEGLDHVVEGGGIVVGCTGGVGQSARVDGGDWAILISDIGCELSVLGVLTTSVCLPAATIVVATLSLSRSVSTTTAVGLS